MCKKIIVFTLVILLVFTAVLFPSCKENPKDTPFSARLDGATLRWDAYTGASAYQIKCTLADGSGYTLNVKETSFTAPYTTPGNYLFEVSALNGKGKVLAKAAPLTYHLGTGEATDPILIGSAADLKGIAMTYTLSFGKTKVDSPLYYLMTDDIDLTGMEFSPLGNSDKPFKSVFDGAGHTIKGLTITKCNTDGNVGLFGFTKNAVIKNINFVNPSIVLDKNSGAKSGELNCGILVGEADSSLVDNCHVINGNLDILHDVTNTDSYALSVGGIVGKAESGRISNVSFRGDVKGRYGRAYAGGIVGFSEGTTPPFMLLNAMADANVYSMATAYSASTGRSDNAYSRAGLVIGSLSDADRVASILALGTAVAEIAEIAPVDNKSSGVFGRARDNTTSLAVPIENIYYIDSVEKVVGSNNNLGTYAKNVHPLSEEQMRDKESFALSDGRYGLDFENYWDIPEGSIPTLKHTVSEEQPSLMLTVKSEIEEHEFSYDFLLEDVANSTYYDIESDQTTYLLGYKLDEILNLIGTGISSVYDSDAIAKGVSVRISAEGMEDRVLTTKKISLGCYLQYGIYVNHEDVPDIFGGYKIINTYNLANIETYDYTGVNHITITFLPTENAEE